MAAQVTNKDENKNKEKNHEAFNKASTKVKAKGNMYSDAQGSDTILKHGGTLPSESDPVVTSHLNPLHGNHLPSPIRGLVFDVGSTLVFATSTDQSSIMRHNMLEIIGDFFNWSNEDRKLFFHYYRELLFEFDQRKLHIGTGTVMDEGWIHEPTVDEFVYNAIDKMSQEKNINYRELLEKHKNSKKNSETGENNEDIIKKALIAFRQPRIDDAKLIPGVIEFLEWCIKMDIKCAICSNDKEQTRFHKIIEKFQLKKYFDIVIVSAATTYRKPDIRVLNDTILIPWDKKYGINKKEVVFVGDKLVTDILVSRYIGIRSILCNFYDRSDKKYKPKPKKDPYYGLVRSKHSAYIGVADDSIGEEMVRSREEFMQPDYHITSYDEFPDLLRSIAKEPIPLTAPLTFNVHHWRPIVIGFILLPTKFAKFEKRGLFDVSKYRGDVICKKVSLFDDLSKQGPFDILVTKPTPWYFAAKNNNQLCKDQLNKLLSYINECNTNFNYYKTFGNNKLKEKYLNGNIMYIVDDPNVAGKSIDRWHIFETIEDPELSPLTPVSTFQSRDITAFLEYKASMANLDELVLNSQSTMNLNLENNNSNNNTNNNNISGVATPMSLVSVKSGEIFGPTPKAADSNENKENSNNNNNNSGGNSKSSEEDKEEEFNIYEQKEYHVPRTILFPKDILRVCFDNTSKVQKYIDYIRKHRSSNKDKNDQNKTLTAKEKEKEQYLLDEKEFGLPHNVCELLSELNKFKFPIFCKTRFSGTSAETLDYEKTKDNAIKGDLNNGKNKKQNNNNNNKKNEKENENEKENAKKEETSKKVKDDKTDEKSDDSWKNEKCSKEGHHMFIVPKISLMFDEEKTLLDDSTDWIMQQYLDHNSECHKVYVLGDLVFATINNSTPSIKEIMGKLSDNGNKMIFINSRLISKKQKPNQNKRDKLRPIYLQLAKQLREKFNMNCFGFDMIFRASDNKGYVVDLNFLPSYKSVDNFTSIFIEWMLYEYRKFVKYVHDS